MHTHLLLLPGTLCDERLFAPQIAALSEMASIMVGDLSRDETITGMAERILRSAPPRFALGGLSLGGIVAMEILRLAPERVDRLALIDTNPAADTPDRRATRERHLAKMRDGGIERVITDDIAPSYFGPDAADAGLLDIILAMAVRLGTDVFARQSHALCSRIDQSETLRAATCPGLILCGEWDRICPVEQQAGMARLLGDGVCVVIGRAGHLPTLERPEETTAALRHWLLGFHPA